MQDLNSLLSRQIADPIPPAEFYRELLETTTNTSPHVTSESTVDIPAEIQSILSSLYQSGIACRLIAQLIPGVAGQTIDPNSTRQPITQIPPEGVLADTHPKFTLGSTIIRPSPIERLNEATPDLSNSNAASTLVSGDAWLASDDVLKRQVLLKEPTVATDGLSDSHQQFVREAQIAGQLEHPNILPVYSLAWSADDNPYYTMKLIDGSSFSQHIRKYHTDSPEWNRNTLKQSVDVIISVCNALHYAHTRGVYHGQLNSDSISLGNFGEVMVLNWSEAIVEIEQSSDLSNFLFDLRSIGALLYEVVMGVPLGRNTLEGIGQLSGSCPKPLASIIRHCYLDEPFYLTLADLIMDLRNYSEDLPVRAHSSTLAERASRWMRKHPLQILYITTVSLLVLFTLVTEFFILSQANEAAELSLENTQRITTILLNDNRRIEEQQKKEFDARDTALESLTIAETALHEANRLAELALAESRATKSLELESVALEQAAKSDEIRSVQQDADATVLLEQAKKDESFADRTKTKLAKQAIATLQQQVVHYGARGQHELALVEARQLNKLSPLLLKEPTDHQSYLQNLLGHSYVPKYHLDFSEDELDVKLTQLVDTTGRRIILETFSRSTDETKLTVITETLQPRVVTFDGQINFHFTTEDTLVLLSNDSDGCVVTILRDDREPTHGRLSAPCSAACLKDTALYAGLENGEITIFSTEQLTQSPPIHRLPMAATQIDISNQLDQLAVAFGTKARILTLTTGDTLSEVNLPSEAAGLWFNSNNGLAVLTDQYYINQFVFGQKPERTIRFRPPPTARRLTGQSHDGTDHFLLFDDGTLTRCDRTFKPTLTRLPNFRDGKFLYIGPSRILLVDHKGSLIILNRFTLTPIANPINKENVIVAASLNSETLHVCTNQGQLTTYSPPLVELFSEDVSMKLDKHVLLNDQTPVLVTDGNQVSSPHRASLNYSHSNEIEDLTSLHKGDLLAIKDRDGYTLLLYDGNQLLRTLQLPSETNLGTVQLTENHTHIYACNSTTLFEWNDGTTYTYSHPLPLRGFLNLTLGRDESSLLITSSNQKSVVQEITIEGMEYSKPVTLSTFVRDCFWNHANNEYNLLTTNSEFANSHQLMSLDADFNTNTAHIPVEINHHVFNEATQTLTLATSDHRLVNYSIQTNEIAAIYANCPVITDLRLDPNNNLLLVQNLAQFLIVNADSLNPLTPLIQVALSEPAITREDLLLQIHVDKLKREFIPVKSLIATGITAATMQKILDDQSEDFPELELE